MTELIYTITLRNSDGAEASAVMPAKQITDVPSGELPQAVAQLRDRMVSLGQHIQQSMQTSEHLPVATTPVSTTNGRRAKRVGA